MKTTRAYRFGQWLGLLLEDAGLWRIVASDLFGWVVFNVTLAAIIAVVYFWE